MEQRNRQDQTLLGRIILQSPSQIPIMMRLSNPGPMSQLRPVKALMACIISMSSSLFSNRSSTRHRRSSHKHIHFTSRTQGCSTMATLVPLR